MSAITDTNGAPLTAVNLSLAAESDSAVLVGRVPCAAGLYLASSSESAAQVRARRTGSGDAFVDLAVSPIDLSPHAGETVSYDFRIHAGNIEGRAFVAVPVRVTPNP
ncbi:MAG: hypothetical protein WCD76_14945 [Pyrinomonadaceae bacterium]